MFTLKGDYYFQFDSSVIIYIYLRDVQRRNVVKEVDMSSGTMTKWSEHRKTHRTTQNQVDPQDAKDNQKNNNFCDFSDFLLFFLYNFLLIFFKYDNLLYEQLMLNKLYKRR